MRILITLSLDERTQAIVSNVFVLNAAKGARPRVSIAWSSAASELGQLGDL